MTDITTELIDRVIEREGGYVSHPSDRGGATKYGITQGTLAAWRGHPVTADQVALLSRAEAAAIYRKNYFTGFEAVTDPKVLEFLFDYAVNSGTGRAIKALQSVLGVTADGAFGPKSKAALAAVNQSTLYWPLICERLDFYLRIVGNDHSQAVFAAGWANRIKPFWKVT